MSELIDREALRAAHGLGSDCHDCKRDMKSCQYDRDYSLMDFCEWLDDAPTASPWHRVEDELPKSGTHVLVCCEVRGICGHRSRYVCDAFHTNAKSIPCRYDDDIDSEYDEETDEYYFPEGWWEVIKNWDDYACVAIADFVTHWMPLPEPPKEDA